MIAILAEKPSVAREIAGIVNARTKQDGYLEGNGYAVTWAYGHLITLDSPDKYGYTGVWSREQLPMIPQEFTISPIEPADKTLAKMQAKQLKVIGTLFKKAEKIIVATDAGREGELIFRYIYEYLSSKYKFNTPFQRLWISSLTDKSIREGLANMKPGTDFDNLYQAGKARSEADWLIGMNATRATTINVSDRTVWSVGRVQTPTLCMICKRFLDNKNFKAEPFWTVKVEMQKAGVTFFGVNPTRFMNRQEAEDVVSRLRANDTLTVVKIEKKPTYSSPPLLYDLTSLQKEANSKFGMSAETTLKYCQSLYEKKLMTYPRTGSRYIPEDIYHTLPGLVANAGKIERFSQVSKALEGKKLGRISVNDAKVTDHHALLPTENMPKGGDMTAQEQKIYELVVGRMLESVSEREEKFTTTVFLKSENVPDFPFTVKGSIIINPGWKAVFSEKSKTAEDENESLPSFEENERVPVANVLLLDKFTKAPPLLTESTLLALMETAGKELENEEEREAMKSIGIGTPATRAEIIEKLIRIKYIVRDKKTLLPTEKGLNLYNTVKDMLIANVEMTGKWENALGKIEQGRVEVHLFNEEIRKYTRKCTDELLNSNIEKSREEKNSKLNGLKCPKCGKPFMVDDKICRCADRVGCGFFFWRVVCQRKLTEKDISDILVHGATRMKVKLKKKDGSFFEARLVLDKDGKFKFK